MVGNDRKSKIINIIVSGLFLLFLGINIFLIFDIYKKYSNETDNNKLLNEELSFLNSTFDKKTIDNNELKKEIEELNNIDNNIAESKKELFKLASELEKKIINKETDKKIAYLTFDDGPYYTTHKFLDVLSKYKVKATFFTIGLDKEKCFDDRSKGCHELYKKIVDNGHTIANHSYSHLIFNGLYSSTNSLISQVKKQENFIKEKTNVTTNIFRFPGGSGSAKSYGVYNSAVSELRKMNYGWVDWTAQDGDGGSVPNTTVAFKNLKNSINEDIEVVLFHDYSYVTLSILPQVIEYLQNNNYVILPLFYESVKVNK